MEIVANPWLSSIGTFGLLASGLTTVRSIGRESFDNVVLGRQRSSSVLLLLLLSSEVRGELLACWLLLLLEAMEKRRELARKGLAASRGERR